MRKRLLYLDILRCFAIVLVIILHAMVPILGNQTFFQTRSWYFCIFQNSINRIGVPLFLMISGYLMLSNSSTESIWFFYKKNIQKLIIPLTAWNIIYYIADSYLKNEEMDPFVFLQQFLNQGCSYHMWFIYTLIGIYLMCPFLYRIVVLCTSKELLILIIIVLFPTTIRPLINTIQPIYIYLFDPFLEGYLGYFLLGFWLGKSDLSKNSRILIYLLGIVGYIGGVVGNLVTSSKEAIPLPFNGGYSLNHYLTAAAIFVFVRAIFRQHGNSGKLCSIFSNLSDLVFGVYWIHVLVLEAVTNLLGDNISVLQYIILVSGLTIFISFGVVWGLSRISVFKKILF